MTDRNEPDASEVVPPDFSGKVVVFYVVGAPANTWGDSGVVLHYVSIRLIEGRRFVVGRLPEAVGSEWHWGLQSGIAWDSVAHYLVFASVDDYKNRSTKPARSFWKRLTGGAG